MNLRPARPCGINPCRNICVVNWNASLPGRRGDLAQDRAGEKIRRRHPYPGKKDFEYQGF